MAMSKSSLKSEILAEFESCGWNVDHEHSQAHCLAESIANAVIQHIWDNAITSVDGESIE